MNYRAARQFKASLFVILCLDVLEAERVVASNSNVQVLKSL